MRLGLLTNGKSCEYKMQDKFKEWLTNKDLIYVDEFRIKDVGRIADFLILKNGHLINVEAKCIDLETMMKQLDDHARYCDYSFAFIPDYTMTPVWLKKQLLERDYGLIIYNYENGVITEVLESHQNKNINKILSRKIRRKIQCQREVSKHQKLVMLRQE